jgi:hypothetical protein
MKILFIQEREYIMSLIVSRPKRELAPEGVHMAHVANVEPIQHDEYGEKVRFTFELKGQEQEDGSPMWVFKTCSFRLTPKAALTGVVQDVLGRSLTDRELEGFDLKTLVGCQVQVVVKHKESASGNTYSIIDTIIQVQAGDESLPF